jgi:hypothetical protein
MSRATQAFVLAAVFGAGWAAAQMWEHRVARAAGKLSLEKRSTEGGDLTFQLQEDGSLLLHTSTPGKRYMAETAPLPERPERPGWVRVAQGVESIGVPARDVGRTTVWELSAVMACAGDPPICKICEPGPQDACTPTPAPFPPPTGAALNVLWGPPPRP